MPIIKLKVPRKQDQGKFVAVHLLYSSIPKTAGTAVLGYFRKLDAEFYFDKVNNPLAEPRFGILKCPSQHFHYDLLDSIFNIEAVDFSFSIVRNPFDRIKSDYVWSQRQLAKGGEMIPFDDWVTQVFEKYQSNPYFMDNHLRPQSEFVGPKIKRVFKYEDGMEQIISEVFKECKITISSGEIKLPKKNTSQEYLPEGMSMEDIKMSDETRKKIVKFYKDDFKNFGYES